MILEQISLAVNYGDFKSQPESWTHLIQATLIYFNIQ